MALTTGILCRRSQSVSSSRPTALLVVTPTVPADDFHRPGGYEHYCQFHTLCYAWEGQPVQKLGPRRKLGSEHSRRHNDSIRFWWRARGPSEHIAGSNTILLQSPATLSQLRNSVGYPVVERKIKGKGGFGYGLPYTTKLTRTILLACRVTAVSRLYVGFKLT